MTLSRLGLLTSLLRYEGRNLFEESHELYMFIFNCQLLENCVKCTSFFSVKQAWMAQDSPFHNNRFYSSINIIDTMAVFILEDTLSVWTNLGKHLLLDALCVSSIKTDTRRIMRLDELSFVVHLEIRTTEDSSFRRIMRLVPVFILETHNASNNKCLPKFVQTDNASSSIKNGQ